MERITSLSSQLEQVSKERGSAIGYVRRNCENCKHSNANPYRKPCVDCQGNSRSKWRYRITSKTIAEIKIKPTITEIEITVLLRALLAHLCASELM